MDDRDRVEILDEILRERGSSVQRLIEEWSVPHADPLTYAQAKDLIWQIMAPLGLSLLGFRAAERAQQVAPADAALRDALYRFHQTGEEAGQVLERLLQIADSVRP